MLCESLADLKKDPDNLETRKHAYFDENLPESVEYALRCEGNLPATWEG